tara:strand:- start:615 stop:743 length:129 start_codon:yes stop_codon:yes gene_type:complete
MKLKTIILFATIFLLLVAGMFIFAYLAQQENGATQQSDVAAA